MGFLQLLSTGAVQNITYHCKNSVASFDAQGKTFRKGIKLLGWNDAEILPKSGNQRLQYETIEDTCRVRLITRGYHFPPRQSITLLTFI